MHDKRAKDDNSTSLRAAQYVRMFTDHQKYSTENQADAIAAYAAQRDLTIVRRYEDEGRSGLGLSGRPALKELISDVLLGRADFTRILVYDVSRWGRFQDTDESAHYEFICKEAGVKIEYCAEEFENDGSLMSNVVKNLKRAMAGEYSRELSTKVFAGHCRLIRLGYKQGGPAGYGLQREMIDQNHNSKGALRRGEQKRLQTDRVILKPGGPREIRVIRRIFREFVLQQKTEIAIARGLTRDGIMNQYGKPWTRDHIHYVLVNEKYIGHSVYNIRSFRLGQKMKRNPPAAWVRKDNAFEAIVSPNLFWQATEIIKQRLLRISDEELLKQLGFLWKEKGRISRRLIDGASDMPCAQLYLKRFGSMRNAYALIGYEPEGNFEYIDAIRRLDGILARVVVEAVAEVQKVGGTAQFDRETGLLTVNDEFAIFIMVVRCGKSRAQYPRWKVRINDQPSRDITIVVRTDESALKVFDYYMLPSSQMSRGVLGLGEQNGSHLDAYRFGTLSALFGLSRPIFQTLVTNARTLLDGRKMDRRFGRGKKGVRVGSERVLAKNARGPH